MITQQLRKVGNSYVVTIPKAEVEKMGLQEGDFLAVDIRQMELKPTMLAEHKAYAERNESSLAEVMAYLKDK